jgi:endoglucanase
MADGFLAQFGYNAIRIPLYLAWAGIGEREHDPFVARANVRAVAVVDLANGGATAARRRSGLQPDRRLALCAVEASLLQDSFATRAPEHYTRHLAFAVCPATR